MQKYGPLVDRLREVPAGQRTLTLSFADVEELVGLLPAPAYDLRQWWDDEGHGHARAWRTVGWRVDRGGLDLERQTVRFTRTAARARVARSG